MSGSHDSHKPPLDVLRTTVILFALMSLLVVLHQFGGVDADFDSRGLLALGFVILAAHSIGDLAGGFRLPHITGYLIAGLLFGPSLAHVVADAWPQLHPPAPLDHGVLSQAVIEQLSLLDDLALALIALTAGGELKLKELRNGFRAIIGIVIGQATTILVLVTTFTLSIPLFWPQVFPAMAGLPTPALIAIGTTLASISFATSPAATIAVINDTKSRGPFTSTILSSVVLKDLLVVVGFSIASALAVASIGMGEATSPLTAMGHIGASMGVGVLVGVILHLYLRFIGAELLLFLVALIFTATYAVHQLHGEPAIALIIAGLVVGNFSDRGETLIHQVQKLSTPVYVVFFTLAGAKLHLEELHTMLLPALALVGARTVALVVGVRVGGQLAGASEKITKTGWMGFVSQAGLAIALTTQLRTTLGPDIGEPLFALLLAGIAFHELFGPVLLQVGLKLSGETSGGSDADAQKTPEPSETLAVTREGDLPQTGSAELDEVVATLNTDLTATIDESLAPVLDDLRTDARDWLRLLRLELLRHLRRSLSRAGTPEERAHGIRTDMVGLADAWRDLVLDLVARAPRHDRWNPGQLTHRIDAYVSDALPETLPVPVHPSSLDRRDESRWKATRRAWLRFRHRSTVRDVAVREIARYHLSGRLPARLEGLAALLATAEYEFSAKVSQLFDQVAEAYGQAATDVNLAGTSSPAALARVRDDMDVEFASLHDEVDRLANDALKRCHNIFQHGLSHIVDDLLIVGTLDLPHRKRRFSLVFHDRTRGYQQITTGLQDARRLTAASHALVALHIEVHSFAGRMSDALSIRARDIERRLRAEGLEPLNDLSAAVATWFEDCQTLLSQRPTAQSLTAALRDRLESTQSTLASIGRSIDQLHAALRADTWISTYVSELEEHAGNLTEFYTIPRMPAQMGEWSLPRQTATRERALRNWVMAFLEQHTTKNLLEYTAGVAANVAALVARVQELERVLSFNVDLALAELEVLEPDALVPEDVTVLVGSMVVQTVERTFDRLPPLVEELASTVDNAQRDLSRVADELSKALHDNESGTVGANAAAIARRAGRWSSTVPHTLNRWRTQLQQRVPDEQWQAWRGLLGWTPSPTSRTTSDVFAPPVPQAKLPRVYTRLFAQHAGGVGDWLVGRQAERTLLDKLWTTANAHRAAALIGTDNGTAQALATSAHRAHASRPLQRWSFDEPVSPEQAQSLLTAAAKSASTTHLVSDLSHWFDRYRVGFAPLDLLLSAIAQDDGRHVWILQAQPLVWEFINAHRPAASLCAAIVPVRPLTEDGLTTAVMARHAMSGFSADFQEMRSLLPRALRPSRRNLDQQAALEHRWFRELHQASHGALPDAFRLWLAAIDDMDDGARSLQLGRIRGAYDDALQSLPESTLLTLLELGRQGWTHPEQHARLFGEQPSHAAMHLSELAQLGLVVSHAGSFTIAPHLANASHRVLAARGWTGAT